MKIAIFLIVFCVGLGFGAATWEHARSTRGWKNVSGVEENMDKVIETISDPNAKKPGRVEVIGGTQLDFGTMKRGTRRSHKFVFKNVGEQPIDIWFKNSSCKCTVGKFEKATLEPKAETEVELEWIVEGMEDFAQTATIGTSAREQEEVKLTIRGRVGQPLSFEPPALFLGDFLSNDESEYIGRMFNLEDTPIEFQSTSIADPELAKKIHYEILPARTPEPGEFPKFASAKQVIEFKIKLLKGIPSGNISTELVFRKDNDNASGDVETVSFKIAGRCVNPIRVIAGNDYDEEKDTLNMGVGSSQSSLKRVIMLAVKTADNADASITLKRIAPESLAKILNVSVGEPKVSKTQKIFPITLEIPAGAGPIELNGNHGKDFGKVVFDTNMVDSPEESIFVRIKLE